MEMEDKFPCMMQCTKGGVSWTDTVTGGEDGDREGEGMRDGGEGEEEGEGEGRAVGSADVVRVGEASTVTVTTA